ncbi:MAG: alpha-glucosidase C-terminal domain-containing protein [Saprospiraceae bacterium]|nr:alpha-glucosidase C-terminal domain-containing protein [Saprospiraceae bacterium]
MEENIVDPRDGNGNSMGWSDVAALNYENREMRKNEIGDMKFWLEKFNIDGFRQDMALLVPLDFWVETTPKLLQAKPDIFLLAESEIHEHLNDDCFHAIYGWTLHHILNDIAKGHKGVSAIDEWYINERPKAMKGLYMHFTSNHDENSWSGSEIERMGEAHKAFAILVNTIDGIPLTYCGQEEPMAKRLDFFEKDDIGFRNYAYSNFYKSINKLKHDNAALWNGEYGGKMLRIIKNDNIFAFSREKDQNKITVIINLSKQMQTVTSDTHLQGVEVFTKKKILINEGDNFLLKPWEYLIIKTQ